MKDWPVEKLELLRDDIADVVCWFKGFSAAKAEFDPPPGLHDLERFGIEVRNKINEIKLK